MAAEMLWEVLTGVAAAQWLPLQRFDACRGAELADTNRRQVCEAVATTLAERSDSMLFALNGARIGQAVGWDEARLIGVRALSLALADSGSAIPDQQDGMSYSCGGVRAILARASRLAEVGEPQVARDWIAASGKSLESFARVARDQAAARPAREAQQASDASAASAASSPRPGG